jgi:tetratricopeptide (TPR) repeat protein
MIDLTTPESKEETVASLMAMPLIAAHTAGGAESEDVQFDRTIALRLASETAGEFGEFDAAINFRQQLLTASPTDENNRIELIRLLAANGKKDEASQNLAATIADRNATRTLRWQAIWLTSEIAGDDLPLWVNVRDRVRSLSANDSETNTALEALSLSAAGKAEEAIKVITAAEISMPNEYLSSLQGIIQKRNASAAGALQSFTRALIATREPAVSKSFGFFEDKPLEQIVVLYLRQNQPLAALKVAERVSAFQTNKNSVEQKDKAVTDMRLSIGAVERYQTLRERAENREQATHVNLLAMLSAAAEQVGDLNRALELERLRLSFVNTVTERKATEARLDHLQQLQSAAARARRVSLVVDQKLVASD